MTAMLRELQQTLSQVSNQLGIRQIAAESSQGRVDAKMQRMETTSITPQESISSPATIPDTITVAKFSNQQVDEISAEKKESKQGVDLSLGKIASPLKSTPEINTEVHVSDSENLRNIEPLAENSVLANLETVVKKAKIQTNIRMDVVNGDVERIQRVMSTMQNFSACQVFDKMSAHKERLTTKTKKKLSLSLKTWKFKFKNKTLQHNWSQWELLQVIDRSKINNMYLCLGANFGLVRNKRTFHCLRLQKQAHKSRVLYHLRMLHDPGGKTVEHSDEIFDTEVDIDNVQRPQMDTVAESHSDVASSTDVITKGQTPACAVVKYSEPATSAHVMQTADGDEACGAEIDALEGTGTWIVTSLPANNIEEALLKVVTKPVTEGTTTGFKEVFMTLAAPVSQLNCFNLPLHHVTNNGLLVFPWHLLFLEFFLSIHLEDKVCLSGASNSWCGWMVFDRGKNIIISEDVITLKRDGQKMLLVKVKDAHVDSLVVSFKELWIEIMDGDIAKLLNSTSGKLQSYGYVRVVMFLRRLRVHHRQQKRKFTKAWKFKYKSRFQEISLTDTQFLCEKVQRVSCLSLAAQFNSLAIIKAVLEQIIQGETSTKIIDNAASSSGSHAKSLLIEMGFCPTLVQKAIGENGEDLALLLEILTKSPVTEEPSFRGLMEPKPEPDIESAPDIRRMTLLTMQFPENLVDLALDRLGKGMPNWERMSIWHRWRRKDCTRPSSCVLPLLFSFFKLEDKLVLRGESIDTILHRIQSFYRKKKQLVTWQSSS